MVFIYLEMASRQWKREKKHADGVTDVSRAKGHQRCCLRLVLSSWQLANRSNAIPGALREQIHHSLTAPKRAAKRKKNVYE